MTDWQNNLPEFGRLESVADVAARKTRAAQEAADAAAKQAQLAQQPRTQSTWASIGFYILAACGLILYGEAKRHELDFWVEVAMDIPLYSAIYLASIRLYGKR